MKKLLLLLLIATEVLPVLARIDKEQSDRDSTIYKNVNLNEIEVISSPKSETRFFEFPGSISIIGEKKLERQHIMSLKGLSSIAPNLYIPDYGSKLISSIYIRGIGSRINSPAVGLNVDNVPYLDKSSFDFDFMDIEKIEILRGPQGTLYGRNTMAGLINIYTKSPFDYQGTKIKAGYGNHNTWNAALSHSHKINEYVAFSVSGKYRKNDGYFKNIATGKNSGSTEVAGGRAQIYIKINPRLKINLTSDFEYNDQDGYPYQMFDKKKDIRYPINYNDRSSYDRKLSTSSILLQYIHDRYIMNSITGYQFLKDNMHMDQDFTPLSVFTLQQKQKQDAITQEITFKSTTDKNLQWVAGVFGFYSHLRTDGPVNFKEDGLKYMIEDNVNSIFENINGLPVQLGLKVQSPNLYINGIYKTPTFGLAVFKQMTYNNLFIKNLSGTIGLRLDYEHTKINHHTFIDEPFISDFNIILPPSMGGRATPIPVSVPLSVDGKNEMNTWELLPKFELKYKFNSRYFIYASVARGYRSGGYNFQMFSNIVQEQLRSKMITEILNKVPPKVKPMLPDLSHLTNNQTDVNNSIRYKPEHSWNYEIGGRADLWDRRLGIDFSVFYIDCRNQQISIIDGFGRTTKNSGHSASKGSEVSVRLSPVNNLQLTAAYGYTHATFISNEDGNKGNYVPFAPKHTLALTGNYTIEIKKSWLDYIFINAEYAGRGKTFWTESNDVAQNFYGLLNGDLTFQKNNIDLSIWGKNLLNKRYQAFYFETMNAENLKENNGFMQLGRPITFGFDVTLRF